MRRFDENLTKFSHAIFRINTSADKKKLKPLKIITAVQERQSMRKCKGEELLIALLKSEQSHAELYKSKSNNTEIEETIKIFNEIRNKLSKSKIKDIEKYLYKREKELKSENEKEKNDIQKNFKKIKNFLEGLREEAKKSSVKWTYLGHF